MVNYRLCGLFVGAAGAAIMNGNLAAAQQASGATPGTSAPASQASDHPQANAVAEVIVTAQKRSENVQTVPLAISALSSATLERTATRGFEDLAALAPSVSFGTYGPAEDLPSIRGVVSGGGFTATTGFYIDEIPFAATFSSGGTDLAFFDVNHVEVLRGPQGTLYGAGAMGGAIRILTNSPNLEDFGGNIELTGGSIAGRAAEYDANGVINVPLIQDQLALRVAGSYIDQGAYIYDPVHQQSDGGDLHKRDLRAKLEWRPDSKFTATLTGIYGKTYQDNYGGEDLLPGKTPQYGDLEQVTYVPTPTSSVTNAANLLMSYQFPWATLVSSTSYINEKTVYFEDDTLSLGTEIPAALHLAPEAYQFGGPPNPAVSYVEELRLVSASAHPFKWAVGGYYQNDDLQVNRIDQFEPGQALSSLSPLTYLAETKRTFYAAFGEATYDFNEQWHLTAGARYTYVPDTLTTTVYGVAFGAAHATAATAVNAVGTVPSSDFSPKVEVTFTPSHNFLFYVEAARGFRPGDANVTLPPTVANIPHEQNPDHLWDYEVGAKTQWFDGHLVANSSLYYIDWTDIQIQTATTPTATTIAFPYLANIGGATIKGAELELRAVQSRELSFGLSGAYTDATFSQASPSIGVVEGQRIAYVPKWSGSASVDYNRPLSNSIGFFAHADVRYNGNQSIGYTVMDRGITTSPYALVGANVGLSLPSATQVKLFVRNLTNDRAQLYITATAVCPSITSCASIDASKAAQLNALVSQPRTFGVTVIKKF